MMEHPENGLNKYCSLVLLTRFNKYEKLVFLFSLLKLLNKINGLSLQTDFAIDELCNPTTAFNTLDAK